MPYLPVYIPTSFPLRSIHGYYYHGSRNFNSEASFLLTYPKRLRKDFLEVSPDGLAIAIVLNFKIPIWKQESCAITIKESEWPPALGKIWT